MRKRSLRGYELSLTKAHRDELSINGLCGRQADSSHHVKEVTGTLEVFVLLVLLDGKADEISDHLREIRR